MKKIFGLGIIALSISACNSGMATDSSANTNAAIAAEMRLQEIQDSLTLDSFRRVEAERTLALERELETDQQQASSPVESSPVHSVSNESAPQPVAETPQKKGWSDAAKGTAIGAGVGAGVGALIDKDKRLRGAAIGAAIGGGSGYAIGRKSDRKSGRVQKK